MKKPIKQINNIYGYVRVSTEEQVVNGVSLETQKEKINDFVQDKFNREVDRFFVDAGVSGTIPITERPESREMTDIMDENDVVVSTRLDRLSRTTTDLLSTIPVFEQSGVTYNMCEQFGEMPVVYPKTKAENSLDTRFNMEAMANQIMIMVLSAVAEIEHGTTVDRLKEGKLVWADKGYSIGGKTPFGYKKLEEKVKYGNRTKRRIKLVEDPAEQEILTFIRKLRARGLGSRRISKQIDEQFPDAAPFPYWLVEKILRRKKQGLH